MTINRLNHWIVYCNDVSRTLEKCTETLLLPNLNNYQVNSKIREEGWEHAYDKHFCPYHLTDTSKRKTR